MKTNNNRADLLISSAFCWPNTVEGYSYWKEIDGDYKSLLKTDNTNNTMKQTIEVEVPEGKKAVWKDNKVVFEDIKPELPKSWEEFCKKYPIKSSECVISSGAGIFPTLDTGELYERHCDYNANSLPSKEAAEAHLALMQLHQLRDCYRQGWVPDWNRGDNKWCIINQFGINSVIAFASNRFFLAFQKKEIAEKFLHNFESLIEKAGDLI